jgi:hypothetical protein
VKYIFAKFEGGSINLSLWVVLHINFDKVLRRLCRNGRAFLQNSRCFPQKLRGGLIKYYFHKFEGVFVELPE